MRNRIGQIIGLGVLLGVTLLAGFGPPGSPDDSRTIVVTLRELERLDLEFVAREGREPSILELRREIEEHLRTELFHREAILRDIYRDPVVHSVLRERLAAVAELTSNTLAPTEEEIRAYHALRQDFYGAPLSEVREQVLEDIASEARTAVLEQLYQEIARDYRIILDPEVESRLGGGAQ